MFVFYAFQRLLRLKGKNAITVASPVVATQLHDSR